MSKEAKYELREDIGGAYALTNAATGETVRVFWNYAEAVAAERAMNGGAA